MSKYNRKIVDLLKFFHCFSNADFVKESKNRLPYFVYFLDHFFVQYMTSTALVTHLRDRSARWTGENLRLFLFITEDQLELLYS